MQHLEEIITVLIADDEPLAREAIRLRLQPHPDFRVIAEADNGSDACLLLDSLKPEVVFMDINMPKLSGLEVAEKLIANTDPCLIFITACEEHALKAFRLNALDYLTKPINDHVFDDMLGRIRNRVSEKRSGSILQANDQKSDTRAGYLKRISIKDEGEVYLYETDDIESVTSVKDYLCIKIKGKIFIHRQTMRQIASLLNPEVFIRCHRSHLVNANCVSRWLEEEGATYLVCGTDRHPVSRRFRNLVKARLNIT